MLRWFKGKKNRLPSGRRASFFKPFLEVLEDRRLLSGSGFLQGMVLNDTDQTPLSGAIVQLQQQQTGGSFVSIGTPATTGANGPAGSYLFTGLEAGTYQLIETPPLGYVNDATEIVQSPVESIVPINPSTVQVTIPSSLTLTINASQFAQQSTTNMTNGYESVQITQDDIANCTNTQYASTEILSFEITGTPVQDTHDIYVGQFIASANNGPSFNTFCIDLNEADFLQSGSNVFSVQPQTNLNGLGPNPQNASAGKIDYLYNTYGITRLTSVDAAALQVAIWTLEYNTSPDFQSSTNPFYLESWSTTNDPDISQDTYNAVVAQAQTYLSDAVVVGHSGQAIFLAPTANLNAPFGGMQGMIAPGSLNFSNTPKASPTISTQASETADGVVGNAILSDSATIADGDNPTGTITFTLTQPDGTTITVGSAVTVNGNSIYNAPTVLATQVGTYTWHASYSGDSLNNGAIDNGNNESITTVKASPAVSTQATETAGGVVGTAVLSDSATVTGGDNPAGTITFTLTQPDGTTIPVGSAVTVSGNSTYSSLTVTATQVGTYTWHASYSGDSLNNGAIDNGNNESLITVKASPTVVTMASFAASIGNVVGSAIPEDSAVL
ncbi:MAG TPA: SpaA isopeptide-forming pilin-related protein, partial [Gemmataceae bacterium]|nr:SpaA isopeptide-forming pilin-related protein [Gemmataceae bacterium]